MTIEKPNQTLAYKRRELIEKSFLPTGNDITVKSDYGIDVLKNGKQKIGQSQ